MKKRKECGRGLQLLPVMLVLVFGGRHVGCAEQAPRYVLFPYVQAVTPTSAVICWETMRPVPSVLTVGDKRMPLPRSAFQEVRVAGLAPDTWYTYAVNGKQMGRFRTFPAGRTAPVRFVIYGDSRSQPEVHRRLLERIAAENPLFVFHSGDFVLHGEMKREWIDHYFLPARKLAARVPVFTAVGNHEMVSMDTGRILSPWYHRFFVQPGNERWYSFDAGCVHVVVLDSNIRDREEVRAQKKWLAEDLRKNRAAWTFVVLHHSPLSRRAAGLSTLALNEYVPLFFAHGVDFVFAGHDHYYKRSFPFRKGGRLVRFFISAGGGAPLRKLKRREPWDARALSRYHFCLVEASPEEVKIRVKTDDGAEIDSVSVRKGEAAPPSVLPFDRTARRLKADLRAIFLEDEDEINETVAVEFPGLKGDPRPGERVQGTVRILANPFGAPMKITLAWNTAESSWKVSPRTLVLQAPPGRDAAARFTAVPGRPLRPGPAMEITVSFGGDAQGAATRVLFAPPRPVGAKK